VADFKALLTDLNQGKTDLDRVRGWIDEAMMTGSADPHDLLRQLDGAGLGPDASDSLRTHLRNYAPDAGGGAPAFDFDLTLDLPSEPEKTQLTAPPAAIPDLDFGLEIDPDKTVAMGSDDPDKTVAMDSDRTVAMGSGQDDRTQAMGDRTVQVGADDRTVQTGTQGGEVDPFALDSQRTSPTGHGSPTGGSWPTGTAWPGAAQGKPLEIGPGAILKDRFELVSPLGEGGMGVVYKARDLLKVEAKDRNPYVAVKLLTGDFKQHPESFIALQRESSKAQRLAHPNIATVFDFDRDRGTVYMTMEVMDGQELAKYIKKLPAGGLPVEEALRITKQMCDGLAYAHQRGLVHSDFKPGNCFILQDGSVKIMDFGIARASKTKGDAEGESTVFDPGQLGALTPAYATVEMFEGEDPAPPDDIYALAITAYELLTGKHPFNKLSAVKVLEKGLSPAPVVKPGWTKRQNRGLMKAMALKRADRTQSVEQFWEDIRPKKDNTLLYTGIGTAIALLIGFAAYTPIKNALDDKRNAAIVQNIVQGGDAAIPDALAQVETFDDRSRRAVLENQEAKDKILDYFMAQAQDEANVETGKYNYAKALAILDDAEKRFYPDSAALLNLRRDIEDGQANLKEQLQTRYAAFVDNKQGFLPDPKADDLVDVLTTFKAVEPTGAPFNDVRIPNQYTTIIQGFARNNEWKRADEILGLSLGFFPADPGLLGLKDQVGRELKRQQDNQLVADIKQRLATLRGKSGPLDEFNKARADLLKLNELRPDDALLGELNTALRSVIDSTLAAHIAAKQWETAERVLGDYAQLLTVPDLLKKREDLSRAEVGAGWQPPNVSDTVARLDALQKGMRDQLAKPAFDAEWDAKLLSQYKDTIAALRPGNTWFDTLRKDVVDAYLDAARKATTESRFDTAALLLDTGERFQPGMEQFASLRTAVTAARTKYEAEQAEAERLAKLEADKASLITVAGADQAQRARAAFDSLRDAMGADDAWIKGQASEAMGKMYASLAEKAMKDNPTAAAQFVREGLRFTPNMQELKTMNGQMAGVERKGNAFDAASAATLASIGDLRGLIDAARQALPAEGNAIMAEAMRRLAARIKDIESKGDINGANDLWNRAKEVFPNTQALTTLSLRAPTRPSAFAESIQGQIGSGTLTAARAALNTAKQREPGHPQLAIVEDNLRQAEQRAGQLYQQYLASRGTNKAGAKSFIDSARKIWTDNPTYEDDYKANYQVTTGAVKAADGSKPCLASLATFGKSARAECFDMPGGQRGPVLVVVPAGGGSGTPYAIGKYEVSVGEYNAVCRATSLCQIAPGDATLPVTNLSLNTVKGFIDALSQATGKQYRLPTESEWTHAATGTNANEVSAFNCRVQQGDQILKGVSLIAVRTGTPNAWGLTNFVGNAQEFVAQGAGAVARGGAFSDSLSVCNIALSKPTNGAADPVTGFRVARNID
jgi:serine/threonine protein kinase